MVKFSKHPTANIYDLRSAISPLKIIQISCRTSRSEENLLIFCDFLLLFKFWTVFLVSSFYLSVNIVVFHPGGSDELGPGHKRQYRRNVYSPVSQKEQFKTIKERKVCCML